MDTVFWHIIAQFQQPTLSFLLAGMALAAMKSRFILPENAIKVVVAILLLKIGMNGGMSIKAEGITALILPGLAAALLGIGIVLLAKILLVGRKGIHPADAWATAGLFGAVSASTLAAGMMALDQASIPYEGYIAALYPFMDLAALLMAITMGKMAQKNQTQPNDTYSIKTILIDTLQSPPVSALLIGLALGLFANPQSVYDSFYEPLFRGTLTLLMIMMGIEAWKKLHELKNVAYLYLAYGLLAPFLHGALGLGIGYLLHLTMGFSAGGAALLAIMAASSSDISGPPTLRAALPQANPSSYIGTSTGIGTPIAILSIPLWISLATAWIG